MPTSITSGKVDPVRDIEVINTELILSDLESVKKRANASSRTPSAATRQRRQRNRFWRGWKNARFGQAGTMLPLTPEEKAPSHHSSADDEANHLRVAT